MVRRIPLLLLLAACQTRSAPPPKTTTPSPPAKSPASMSHGEATINNPAVPLERAADAPARSTSHLHYVRLRTVHISRVIAPGVVYQAWTFDSVVPAPTVRVTVGDTVDFTLVNGSPIPHSIDFHAAQVAPSRAYVNVNPKDSIHFRFVARVPGVFMYHCGTAPVALHISNGMFGALIVDPVTPRPPAREFVLVQSEYYLAPTHDSTAPRSLDWQRMLDLSPDYVVFNGVYAQYAAHPIPGGTRRAAAVLCGRRRTEPRVLVPRRRRDLRAGVCRRHWTAAARRADGQRTGGWRHDLRDPAGRAGTLSVRLAFVRGCNQGCGWRAARRESARQRQSLIQRRT